MAKKKPNIEARVIMARNPEPVQKAETTTQLDTQEQYNAGEWIEPPADLRGYKIMVDGSTILPQCIRAYKQNICGFGIGIRYIEDEEETAEMAAEYTAAKEIITLLTIEEDTKELFERIVEARETYGIAYTEIIRNLGGGVEQVDFITDTPSMRKTMPLDPYIEVQFYHMGKEIVRKKRFRKYKQQIGGKTVYFKEFGDPRIMDRRTGDYLTEGEALEIQYQANEILEFKNGNAPYGEVRWSGQILGVDGSRRAEKLNNNYFTNGRHTPLMIIVKNGTLTEDSFAKLQQYMDEIKGEKGQHAFLLLETEASDGRTDFDQTERPDIEIKDIASILQKDELFQDYLDNNRKKVQSAFQLPDLYVGYTTDFNRATAQTAVETTEEQVFQPHRNSLAWIINHKLLGGYQFRFVEAYFKEPNLTNPDDIYKILSVCARAGGLTPNKAKEVIYSAIGEVAEPFEGEWAETPLAIMQLASSTAAPEQEPAIDVEQITMSLEKQIKKAAAHNDDAIVAVMKEVRNLLRQSSQKGLQSLNDCAIMKGNPDQPRDEHGRFASTGASGAHEFKVKGFRSKAKANNHFTKHKAEFEQDGIKTVDQYIARALELVESATGGDIQGHMDKEGNVIRYDSKQNQFVKGHPEKGITTFIKPVDAQAYYDMMREEDIAHGGQA